MFDNIGGKIKGLAKFITVFGIIVSVIVGACILDAASKMYPHDMKGVETIPGFTVMVVGSVISWLSSLVLYAFGQLVESAKNLEEKFCSNSDTNLSEITQIVNQTIEKENYNESLENLNCPICGEQIKENARFCTKCGTRVK